MGDSQTFGEVLHGGKAVALASVFLVCALMVVVFTGFEFAQAGKLEIFSETTAAGDMNYFRVPPDGSAREAVFTLAGRRLVLMSEEKVKIDDTEMFRMGRDETTGYNIYSVRSGKPDGLFIKIDVSEFLPLKER